MPRTYSTVTPDEIAAMEEIVQRLADALEMPVDELLSGKIKFSRMEGGHYHAAVTDNDDN